MDLLSIRWTVAHMCYGLQRRACGNNLWARALAAQPPLGRSLSDFRSERCTYICIYIHYYDIHIQTHTEDISTYEYKYYTDMIFGCVRIHFCIYMYERIYMYTRENICIYTYSICINMYILYIHIYEYVCVSIYSASYTLIDAHRQMTVQKMYAYFEILPKKMPRPVDEEDRQVRRPS